MNDMSIYAGVGSKFANINNYRGNKNNYSETPDKKFLDELNGKTPDYSLQQESHIMKMVSHTIPLPVALRAINALQTTDPERFVDVVEGLYADAKRIAATFVGENHPMAWMIGSGADDPNLDDLILPEGVYLSGSK